MLHYIESLRKKPKPVRNMYAFWGALVMTLIVTGIWSMSLPNRLAQMFDAELLPSQAKQPSQLLSGVKDLLGSMSASVSDSQEENADPELATSTTVFEIDMTQLSKSTTTETNSSSTGVWQRTYELTEGKPVLIATSSAANGE